ncbi:hypothetical protein HPB47_018431 [Ixodes persulcatus]|uniref:Uncharacterized protein n=1 Tax=Ixodes persulcatus TaxID=34615 RepID=A0AC60QPE1_IXOPE|nr:hypothetical protein HPB47_018431 [Ixodes persulcatus]
MNGATAPGPSAEDVPDPLVDDACEDWTEDPSAFRAVEVPKQSPWIAICAARKRALRADKAHLLKLYRLKRNRRAILLTNLADSSTGMHCKL